MATLRITNGFAYMADADLEAKSNQIVAGMSANFATAPGLPALISAITAFSAILAIAKEGSLVDKAQKNQEKEELVEQLHLNGYQVLITSAGDRAKALSSGFSIAKNPSPGPELSKAQNLQTADGQNSGELNFSFDPVPGAKSYIYQSTPDPITDNSAWSNDVGTKSKFLFTALESAKRFWMRVAAVGKDNQIVYSDPVLSRIVQ